MVTIAVKLVPRSFDSGLRPPLRMTPPLVHQKTSNSNLLLCQNFRLLRQTQLPPFRRFGNGGVCAEKICTILLHFCEKSCTMSPTGTGKFLKASYIRSHNNNYVAFLFAYTTSPRRSILRRCSCPVVMI